MSCGVIPYRPSPTEDEALERARYALQLIADERSWRGFSPMPIVERMRETAREALHAPEPLPVKDEDAATPEQMQRANDAVTANLNADGSPKYDSAFGYACALSAIIASDAARLEEKRR